MNRSRAQVEFVPPGRWKTLLFVANREATFGVGLFWSWSRFGLGIQTWGHGADLTIGPLCLGCGFCRDVD